MLSVSNITPIYTNITNFPSNVVLRDTNTGLPVDVNVQTLQAGNVTTVKLG